jgi:protein-disulfide isomerase
MGEDRMSADTLSSLEWNSTSTSYNANQKEDILNSIGLTLKSVSAWVAAAALALTFATAAAFAQSPAPAPSAPAAAPGAAPSAPSPQLRSAQPESTPNAPAAPADPLPPADPKLILAPSPTVDTVNSFLKQVWGMDPNRIWRVMAIVPTQAPGVVKVVVYVTDKSPGAKVSSAILYVTPDGKHAIGEGSGVMNFGATPFAETRQILKDRADGAYRGAASKDLELVEFADLQCPICKTAQTTVDQIVKDFPNAHVVFQLVPLVEIHPSAYKAAAYGVCAQKQSNDAFFQFAAGVFDTQEGLTPKTDDTILKAAAMRAGLDGTAIAECSIMPATKAAVDADLKLAADLGINQTPLLAVNGRIIPLAGTITYDDIKRLIQFQATLDGVNSGATAETLAPAPPKQPTLTNLPK